MVAIYESVCFWAVDMRESPFHALIFSSCRCHLHISSWDPRTSPGFGEVFLFSFKPSSLVGFGSKPRFSALGLARIVQRDLSFDNLLPRGPPKFFLLIQRAEQQPSQPGCPYFFRTWRVISLGLNGIFISLGLLQNALLM